MGFSFDINIPVITVFLQGIISFFSPCILPVLPLYIGYLSGGTKRIGEDGKVYYKRSRVMLNTIFFVAGISFAFLVLGFGMTALGQFFYKNQEMLSRIGGILICFFGLYQLGIFGSSSVLERERRLPFRIDAMAMSPITALLMGFLFSFAWTPCVGPALTSVLIMAASASTQTAGLMLIGVYTLGFVLPFLAVGFFAASLLEFFRQHGKIVKYTVKAGGVLLLLMGIVMFTGKMNSVTETLAGNAKNVQQTADSKKSSEKETETNTEVKPNAEGGSDAEEKPAEETEDKKEEQFSPAIDFTLTDQYGNSHTLSDYKGKTVFLNFWATWCPPCRAEMPDIQKIYENYKENKDESLVILGVAAPGQGQEGTAQEIAEFLEENGYTYPVLMDTTGEQFMNYSVYALPTTFMIDKDGNVFGYVSGQLSEEIMMSIIEQTMEGKR